jgi:transposase
VLDADPFSGHLFVFRGKRADYLKILYWDGTGLCLFAKRLENGRSSGRRSSMARWC